MRWQACRLVSIRRRRQAVALVSHCMPKGFVVDASVAVKWLNQRSEENADRAVALLAAAADGQCHLYTSDLLTHEVMNALIRGKQLTGRMLERAVDVFFKLPITIVATAPPIAARASLIAAEFHMTFYDAVYVALAHERGVPLVTANVKHQGKFPGIEIAAIATLEI